MRALWCTVIALCLVAAGAQPRHAQRSRDTTSTLRVAAAGSTVAVRRSTTPHIGAYVAPAAIAAPTPHRQLVAYVAVAPHVAAVSQARSARSSRGPPHV